MEAVESESWRSLPPPPPLTGPSSPSRRAPGRTCLEPSPSLPWSRWRACLSSLRARATCCVRSTTRRQPRKVGPSAFPTQLLRLQGQCARMQRPSIPLCRPFHLPHSQLWRPREGMPGKSRTEQGRTQVCSLLCHGVSMGCPNHRDGETQIS